LEEATVGLIESADIVRDGVLRRFTRYCFSRTFLDPLEQVIVDVIEAPNPYKHDHLGFLIENGPDCRPTPGQRTVCDYAYAHIVGDATSSPPVPPHRLFDEKRWFAVRAPVTEDRPWPAEWKGGALVDRQFTVQHPDGPITLVLPVRNSKLRGSFTLECWSSPTPRE